MTKREIANLCVKMMALYCLVNALAGFPYLADMILPLIEGRAWTTIEIIQAGIWALHPIILFSAFLFLWKSSWLVAAWMVGYDIQDSPSEPDAARPGVTAAEFHGIAISTLGLWVLAEVVPRLLSFVVQYVYWRTMPNAEVEASSRIFQAGGWLDLLARVFIGCWLVFGASGLASWIATKSHKSAKE